MLEQQQVIEAAQQTCAPLISPNHDAALVLTPHAQVLIAGYIAQAEAEQQSAIQQRLEELVAAHLELDAEPEQAARSAIQQIENERLAAQARHTAAKRQAFEQRKRTRRAKQSVRPATLTALKLFGPGATGMFAAVAALSSIHAEGWLAETIVYTSLLLLPVLLGAGVGLRARHRRMLGTFLAMAMLIPLLSPVVASVFTLLQPGTVWTECFWVIACILTLFWLPIGVAAAGLTGWARDAFAKAVEAQSQKSPE